MQRCVAECVGTFAIVFAPVAFVTVGTHLGRSDLLGASLVSGLAVLVMVYTFGHISAAHFNPAVTLGFACAGRFPWRHVPKYWGSQLLGAVLAGFIVSTVLGPVSGTHIPAVMPLPAILIEAILTGFLMLTIMSVATDRRVNSAVPGLAIGMIVVVDVMIGGPVTGGSMNPARSLGPAIFTQGAALHSVWIYFGGPALGAVGAAKLYEWIRGNEVHAQAAPNDLSAAMENINKST